jgi:hypothetical protein
LTGHGFVFLQVRVLPNMARAIHSRELFATVLNMTHAGEWAGSPIAFIHDDFTFNDEHFVQLYHSDVTRDSSHCVAHYVYILFCFDKSPTNFSIHKFCGITGTFLCPVKAMISLLCRAAMLGIPADFPSGAFWN